MPKAKKRLSVWDRKRVWCKYNKRQRKVAGGKQKKGNRK